jgi:hypothetical protein
MPSASQHRRSFAQSVGRLLDKAFAHSLVALAIPITLVVTVAATACGTLISGSDPSLGAYPSSATPSGAHHGSFGPTCKQLHQEEIPSPTGEYVAVVATLLCNFGNVGYEAGLKRANAGANGNDYRRIFLFGARERPPVDDILQWTGPRSLEVLSTSTLNFIGSKASGWRDVRISYREEQGAP